MHLVPRNSKGEHEWVGLHHEMERHVMSPFFSMEVGRKKRGNNRYVVCGEGAGVELAEGGKDPRGWPVGASVHDAKSGINRLSLRGLPDASPEMGGVSGVGGVVACSLVRFHLSV